MLNQKQLDALENRLDEIKQALDLCDEQRDYDVILNLERELHEIILTLERNLNIKPNSRGIFRIIK